MARSLQLYRDLPRTSPLLPGHVCFLSVRERFIIGTLTRPAYVALSKHNALKQLCLPLYRPRRAMLKRRLLKKTGFVRGAIFPSVVSLVVWWLRSETRYGTLNGTSGLVFQYRHTVVTCILFPASSVRSVVIRLM